MSQVQFQEGHAEFKTSGMDDFLTILKSIKCVNDEVTLVISSEGITCRLMDSSEVNLIDVSWPNSAFEKFECNSDVKVCFNVKDLLNRISSWDVKKSINCIVQKDTILFEQRDRHTTLKRLEPDATDTPLPKIPYDSTLVCELSKFKKDMVSVSKMSDYITIESSEISVKLSTKSDSGDYSITYDKDDNRIEEISAKEDSKSTYSLEYLVPFLRVFKDGFMTLEYSSNKPLRIEMKIANIGRVHFYLGPKIGGDE